MKCTNTVNCIKYFHIFVDSSIVVYTVPNVIGESWNCMGHSVTIGNAECWMLQREIS